MISARGYLSVASPKLSTGENRVSRIWNTVFFYRMGREWGEKSKKGLPLDLAER